MPSMVPMMSEIFLLDSLMPFMVSTTWPTTSPPVTATPEAAWASWLACLALSAFRRTVVPNCSMVAAVSSSALACCSVRWLRSWLPWAICALAEATLSAFPRTSITTRAKALCISPMAEIKGENSSRLESVTARVKSPSRTRWAVSLTSRTRPRSPLPMVQASSIKPTAMAMPITMTATRVLSAGPRTAATCALKVSCWYFTVSAICVNNALRAGMVLSTRNPKAPAVSPAVILAMFAPPTAQKLAVAPFNPSTRLRPSSVDTFFSKSAISASTVDLISPMLANVAARSSGVRESIAWRSCSEARVILSSKSAMRSSCGNSTFSARCVPASIRPSCWAV